MTEDGVQELGETGFNSRQDDQEAINLRDIRERIDEWREQGLVEDDVVDLGELGYDKVLGTGSLDEGLEVHADSFSGSAERKIEEAGGEAVEN